MLSGHPSLLPLDFFDHPRAAQHVASVHGFVLHAPIHFLRFEDVCTVRQSYMNPLADRVWIFTFER